MNESMKNVEDKLSKIEKRIDPPERDLTARDVLRTMTKLVIGLAISLAAAVVIFVGYTMYRDWQYNVTIQKINGQYTEFINSFEFVADSTTVDAGDGGNAGFVGGDGDVNNGTNSSTPTNSTP